MLFTGKMEPSKHGAQMHEKVKSIHTLIAAGRPLILDGGLGGELEARGFDVGSSLWSAALLAAQPEAIARLHRDYLDAGACCITTSSYQASFAGLRAQGKTAAEIEGLLQRSVDIACRARDEYVDANPDCGFTPLVAASIGPYGAFLADGSEYRGNYGLDDDRLFEFHAERLHCLDCSGADLIACETLPDLQEAKVLAGLLQSVSTPAWVSFSCRDATHLHDGNKLVQALDWFRDLESVFAVGVNCCAPALIDAVLETLVAADSGKLIVVYPNSGQQYDAAGKHWHGEADPESWTRRAAGWFAAGAGIIGGCCSVGPDTIRALATIKTWHC